MVSAPLYRDSRMFFSFFAFAIYTIAIGESLTYNGQKHGLFSDAAIVTTAPPYACSPFFLP